MPFARNTDPQTSHDAADSVNNLTLLKSEIMMWLTEYNLTDVDLVAYIKESVDVTASESGIRSRRAELVKAGLVKDSGERVKLPSGRNAIVWQVA